MPLVVVRLPPPEAADAIRRAWDMGRGVLVLDPRAPEAEVDRIVDRLDPDGEVAPDVAAVVVTSGTTGEPKGVELTFGGLQASSRAVSDAIGVRAGGGDRWLCCLPLHHVGGLAVLARSWTVGTPVDVLPRFDVDGGGAASRATLVSLVPLMARRLLAAGVDLGRFRKVLIGGGPVAADLPGTRHLRADRDVGRGGPRRPPAGRGGGGPRPRGRDPRPGPGGDAGLPLADGRRRHRRRLHRPQHPGGGWLRTGDAGAIDGQGRLRVVDRLRDLVKTGGVSVAPTEVEAVLAGHPGVADVCVAGAPDPEWGERVVAYVVPADPSAPPTVDDLRDFARDRLSAAKLPREVVLVDAVPRTPGGKPLRRLLTSTPRPRDRADQDRRQRAREGLVPDLVRWVGCRALGEMTEVGDEEGPAHGGRPAWLCCWGWRRRRRRPPPESRGSRSSTSGTVTSATVPGQPDRSRAPARAVRDHVDEDGNRRRQGDLQEGHRDLIDPHRTPAAPGSRSTTGPRASAGLQRRRRPTRIQQRYRGLRRRAPGRVPTPTGARSSALARPSGCSEDGTVLTIVRATGTTTLP